MAMSGIPQVVLFGKPQLIVGGQRVASSVKQIALLSLFAADSREVLDRAEVASLLWPKASPSSARHSLSQAIYSLKQMTHETVALTGSPTQIRIGPVESDVAYLDRAVSSSSWESAGAVLAKGLFLEGLDIEGCYDFEEWVEGHRSRFQAIASEVAEQLHLDGRSEQAAKLCRIFPTVTLQISSCAQGEAEDVFSGFVGRSDELEWLENKHTLAAQGAFRTVVIEGEPGIGKTALVMRFARRRAIRGSRVLTANGYVAEQNTPFGIVAQWLRALTPVVDLPVHHSWLRIVEAAFPDLPIRTSLPADRLKPDPDVPAGEYRLLEALRRLLSALSAERPLVLVVDDANLADAASLGFVHYFARRSPTSRVLFLGTMRVPTVHRADSFSDWEHVDLLHLGPLSIPDIEALLGKHSAHEVEDDIRYANELASRTGGNPLLLTSLLGTARRPKSGEIPESVINYFVPRLRSLSRDAALLLGSVSVTGDATDLIVAAEVAGMAHEGQQFAAALSELEEAGLIIQDAGGIHVKHGIVAEVALTRLTEARRKAVFGRAARILKERGTISPAALAVHHDIAGDEALAFEAAVSAASASALLYATREREFFLKLALSNAPNDLAESGIRIELADHYRKLGRLAEGLEIIAADSIATAPPELRCRARASQLAIETLINATPSSLNHLIHEVDDLSGNLDPQVAADLYLHVSSVARDLGEGVLAVEAAKRSLRLNDLADPSPESATVAIRAATVLSFYSGPDQGLAAMAQMIATPRKNLGVLGLSLSAQGALLVLAGRLLDAEKALLEALELIERCCMYDALFALHNNFGVCYTGLGRYSEAKDQLTQAARIASELTETQRSGMAAENLAMMYLEAEEYERALQTIRSSTAASHVRSLRGLFHRNALIGLASLELGLLAQAFEAKREIELQLNSHSYWSSDVSYVEMFLARMLAMEGQPAAARERLKTAIDIVGPRDVLCRARLELELARIELKVDTRAAVDRAARMLRRLQGTGARPLIDRFEDVLDRGKLRLS
jgi:tetratricopeptide (TPR) repeat protein